MIVAFDVDGTLIDFEDNPREGVVTVAKALCLWPDVTVIVWSGGGREYARMWADRLGLSAALCLDKYSANANLVIDLAFDDEKDALPAGCAQMVIIGRKRVA